MERREFLRTGIGLSAFALVAGRPGPLRATTAGGPDQTKWRVFEVTTRVEIVNPSGLTRAWIPLPLMPDTNYQKSLGQSWTGNAGSIRVFRDDKYGAGILFAEFPAGAASPAVEVVNRFATRDRTVEVTGPGHPLREDKKLLAQYSKGTRYIPTDGVVGKTSAQITKGLGGDLEKARAIYEWIVDNTFRDPKVRGCGLGDIRAMLETGNLGGKCADLNALFVGLARAAGIPARDVYGVRVADSTEFKSLGKSGDITRAQHCRAEFYVASHGWVPVDPADVRKVVLEEKGGLPLDDPIVQRARAKFFGAWEMNWLAFNYAADVKLPQSASDPLAFFMYPQAETTEGRRDSLDPDGFRYRMTAREIA
ncbi:MAG TPA: transglutaminase-like domain-containing protein [Methylomirabilota bacterium]|jgi:transglutaminase-like putative cysteine protease|nr:transglutaminase-like domain-containing protein [Methylomirabilota bacterium]